ncbi:CAP domain-containing protein [Phaeacidiphilus oryzae]|uniref:CAP domain-containing protein n=1 Tax=Phaeacidiphilus oryzae TaxID=348818 RepID=UPI00068F79BE|nr:CAP domain-containing protein [Phaeacidiphilus oryzae]
MARHARTSRGNGRRTTRGHRARHGRDATGRIVPATFQPARIALVAGCTLLAAGAGGVFSGALPAPPGLPKSLLVAGDPAASYGNPLPTGRQDTAARTPSTGSSRTAGRPSRSGPAGGPAPSAAPASPASASASPSGGGAAASSTAPGAAPSVSASASAAPGPGAPGRASAAQAAAAEAEVLRLVNGERARHGCGSLADSAALTGLASALSGEMAAQGVLGHTDPSGRSPWQRAAQAGITNLGGENIARGQPTPQAVMAAWMKSPGHRANILDCSYHSLGVGVAYGPDGPWWTEDFGF